MGRCDKPTHPTTLSHKNDKISGKLPGSAPQSGRLLFWMRGNQQEAQHAADEEVGWIEVGVGL